MSEQERVERKMEKFSFGEFNKDKQEMEEYLFQFERMCKVKGLGSEAVIQTEARKNLLLAYMGANTLVDIRNHFFPKNIDECSYKEIVEGLNTVYKPKEKLFAARIKFEQAVRLDEESFRNFATRLKDLNRHCQYANALDERLRDRFAGDLRHITAIREIRTRWPSGKYKEDPVSFQKVVDLAIAIETAETETQEIDVTIHKIKRKQDKERWQREKEECGRCGRKHIPPEYKCPAQGVECYECKGRNHFARKCLSKKNKQYRSRRQTKKVNLEEEESPDQETEEEEFELHKINAIVNGRKKATINVRINNKLIKMEYDSGAGVTTIIKEVWESVGKPRLILGRTKVKVECKGKVKILRAVVVDVKDESLFGLPWILAFKLPLPKEVRINKIKEEKEKKIEKARLKREKPSIILKDTATPRKWEARRVAFPMRQPVEAELERLTQMGVIEKVDPINTEIITWATPTVNVQTTKGRVRICGDFKLTLNEYLKSDSHTMPTFEDLLEKIAGGERFSVIELKDAYLQMKVEEKSKDLLIIVTHIGYYRFKRLPFGLAVAPMIFQRFIDELLQGIPNMGKLLDDIIVSGKTEAQHIKNLKEVLRRLQKAGLRTQKKKVQLLQESVNYLGHRLDREGVHPLEEKIKPIKEMPSPQSKKQLKSFLGAVSFYDRFIPHLHEKCNKLYDMISSKSKWKWTDEEEKRFKEKNQLYVIECDASEEGCGSVLLQPDEKERERPVAFASRKFKEAEKNYAAIDKEALAIIYAIKQEKWEELQISPEELQELSEKDIIIGNVGRWVQTQWPKMVEKEYQAYARRKEELSVQDGVLWWLGRMCIPEKMRDKVFTRLHEGHPGINAMKGICRHYVW
ncbi:PREDICTED: uncharacterized protein K02A2.6-like [Cyphomyrmex costatus]|uniref:uncharacterized protein K02A2.6-like n=1 Tax=Cyphomyrmex costatus TaxID=456900 RepID=UPI0008522175|nr:PREDICTED: uncharacterized protein K02A2.6-like [Cyphomyrmex costatus]